MKIIILISMLILSGCSSLSKVADVVSDANDESLASAEFIICRGASIGSIMRKYGTVNKAQAWRALCTQEDDAVVILLNSN